MKANVMVRNVITVGPDASAEGVAKKLSVDRPSGAVQPWGSGRHADAKEGRPSCRRGHARRRYVSDNLIVRPLIGAIDRLGQGRQKVMQLIF
jgi:hypothetical protein